MSVVSMMSWRDKVRSSQSREEVGQIHGEEQSRYGEEQSEEQSRIRRGAVRGGGGES